MTFAVFFPPYTKRLAKKLPKKIRPTITKEVNRLAADPLRGEPLAGFYAGFRSVHLVYRRTHYRLVYRVAKRSKQIIVVYIGTRENAYKELRRLL